ncbi:hypothetical protein ECANGB1_865 [Enterospora canceri]|uniref:Uncharacterized protein n=1 Tax=Enterospora canceri TaxID=1081671 RepID=A0A1Y1S7F4_9MICR|nr:hypothetical protein ECANGB1_865 [Enterospora canceri]
MLNLKNETIAVCEIQRELVFGLVFVIMFLVGLLFYCTLWHCTFIASSNRIVHSNQRNNPIYQPD